MHISDVYQQVRVSKAIRCHVWESQKASCRRTADAVDAFQPGQTARLLPTMKLAARATLNTAGDHRTRNIGFDIGPFLVLRQAYKSALQAGLLPLTRVPFFHSYSAVALYAVALSGLAVGRGAFDHEVQGGCRRVGGEQMLERYGLLGLPEAAFVHAAKKFTHSHYHRAASACLVGAIACAIPLELARVARFGVMMLLHVPTTLATVLINVTYSAARCLWDPTQNPDQYVLFLDAPVRQAKSEAFAQEVHQSVQALSGIWKSTSAAQARQVLGELSQNAQTPGEDARSSVQDLEQLRSTLSGIRGRQLSGRQTIEDLCLLDHLFSSSKREDLAPAPWEGHLFRKVSLRLHPDKLATANPPLPPSSLHVAELGYAIVCSLRELQEGLTPTTNRGFMAA